MLRLVDGEVAQVLPILCARRFHTHCRARQEKALDKDLILPLDKSCSALGDKAQWIASVDDLAPPVALDQGNNLHQGQ